MKRTLHLRREALTELTPYELTSVAGGAATQNGLTCPINACPSDVTHSFPPFNTCQCCTASASCTI